MLLRTKNHWKSLGLIILMVLMGASGSLQAKETRRVQEITGHVELKERPFYYTLPNLRKGQTLYVFMQGTSNSLDPFVALLKPGTDVSTLRQDYLAEEKRLVINILNKISKKGEKDENCIEGKFHLINSIIITSVALTSILLD